MSALLCEHVRKLVMRRQAPWLVRIWGESRLVALGAKMRSRVELPTMVVGVRVARRTVLTIFELLERLLGALCSLRWFLYPVALRAGQPSVGACKVKGRHGEVVKEHLFCEFLLEVGVALVAVTFGKTVFATDHVD